ncbi:MAG: tRNA (guanosine(46)-N7)-methyltransferase TrmB [Lachnospiraceae bacterium]|nr:tRNA (guanosine(46)-N7)-methyltransferase TrmB [Lachnospiraceae bacterium]
MRLRNISGSRHVIAKSPFVLHEPEQYKGHFRDRVFENDHEIHVEIGMGKGRFIMEMAKRHPGINFVGIEKYSSVLLRAIQKMEQLETPLSNLVFIRMDAENIADVFDRDEVSKIYLNFSDPWPKDRHAKRRLPSRTFLHRYEQILKKDGSVEFKTDNTDLFDFALTEAPEASWKVDRVTYDLHAEAEMNAGNIMTEYEERFSRMGNKICKCILSQVATKLVLCFLLASLLLTETVSAVNTVPTEEQALAAENRKLMRVESNEINGWPEGPLLGAESAILMEADTGAILYEKNIHARLYPASTTKLMTGLLALENSTMEDIVTFSHDSIFNIESSSSRIGIDEGEKLTMEQCLYGLLLGSANEVAYAIAEQIGGTYDHFVEMMNERAAALGCEDTHFANANGLPQPDHYSSAYDLAIIAKECFQNDSLATIAGSTRYTIPPTNKQYQERKLDNHHLMLPGFKYAYDGVICGKTGYTSEARQTLVTLAQRGDMRLICVIMREEAPDQFIDTQKLFDYGFNQFQKLNVAEHEKNYTLNSATFFHTNLDIIGSSLPILSINPHGYIVIPKLSSFEDASVSIAYSDRNSNDVITLTYSIDSHFVGETTIDYADNSSGVFEFANILVDSDKILPRKVQPDHKIIFIDTTRMILRIGFCLFCVFVLLLIIYGIRRYITSDRRRARMKRKRFRKWNKKLF